jgi:glycosyltransferase involved in cell wall biosynthesis
MLNQFRDFASRRLTRSQQAASSLSYCKYLVNRVLQRRREPEYDVVFVVLDVAAGWILEAIAQKVAARCEGRHTFHNSVFDLPPARGYYFAHYSHLLHCIRYNPWIWGSRRVAFFTHPKDVGVSESELAFGLNQATHVVCMCTEFHELLASWGVSRERLVTVVGGADPEVFRPHQRGSGGAGFCSSYHWRKNPARVLEIIRAMPHREFVILGPKWEEWERYEELKGLPNLRLVDVAYGEYPEQFDKIDVFVSPSRLEGGPIPLLEAMMANAVPVASRTGFAPDVIRHGENGFLFDVDGPLEEVCGLVDRAFDLPGDVRATVEQYSWDRFSREVLKRLS